MADWLNIDDEDEIDVEEIMRQIRAHIAQEQGQEAPATPGTGDLRSPLASARGSLDAARHLQRDAIVSLSFRRSTLPLIGPLVDRLRRAIHQLVVFYVNKSAVQQVSAATQIIEAVSVLIHEIEGERASAEILENLRCEVQELRDQLTEFQEA